MNPAPPFIKTLLDRIYKEVIFMFFISQFCEVIVIEGGAG